MTWRQYQRDLTKNLEDLHEKLVNRTYTPQPVARRWIPKSIQKRKTTLRPQTRRTNGRCMPAIIADINRTLQGWYDYFRHGHYTTFEPIDQWVRMRLRSILRKRQKKRGRGRGSDHQRWPNAYFAKLGLYTLKTAHALASQSSTR